MIDDNFRAIKCEIYEQDWRINKDQYLKCYKCHSLSPWLQNLNKTIGPKYIESIQHIFKTLNINDLLVAKTPSS